MTGYLTQTLGEWMVKYGDDKKLYPLCPETKKWSTRSEVKHFLKENLEVVFDFVFYCHLFCYDQLLGSNCLGEHRSEMADPDFHFHWFILRRG